MCACLVASVILTFCDATDCSLLGLSNHGIPRSRILECEPFPTPGHLPDPGIEPESPVSPALAGGFFTAALPGKNPFEKGSH